MLAAKFINRDGTVKGYAVVPEHVTLVYSGGKAYVYSHTPPDDMRVFQVAEGVHHVFKLVNEDNIVSRRDI